MNDKTRAESSPHAEILYQDKRILVCVKPPGVLSTDEPGGLCDLLRKQLGETQTCLRTVHRLDRVVGGVMVLARSREAARRLSAQVTEHRFEKKYLAVVRGCLSSEQGVWRDLLTRDRAAHRTLVAEMPGQDVREAILCYEVTEQGTDSSLVSIRLETGRTHQIRAQFSAHGHPLLGDRKYGDDTNCGVALWACSLAFEHPESGEMLHFTAPPPACYPWIKFEHLKGELLHA